jgi:hypothetical protein
MSRNLGKVNFGNYYLSGPMVLLIALMSIADAYAENADNNSWYVGGGLGIANVRDLCAGPATYDCDDQGSMARVFGGMHVNRFVAVEATLDLAGNWRSPGARAEGFDGSTGAVMFGVNLLGTLPLGPRLSLYAGASGAFSYISLDVTDKRTNGNQTVCYYDSYYSDWYDYCYNRSYDRHNYESETSVTAGALAGVDVAIAKRIHVRAQAQRYFNVKADLAFGGRRDVDMFSVNGMFSFR